jgi:hypothetical protein
MQKNKVKSCCQAEADEQQKKKWYGPLAQPHEKASLLCPTFPFLRFNSFFTPFGRHYKL